MLRKPSPQNYPRQGLEQVSRLYGNRDYKQNRPSPAIWVIWELPKAGFDTQAEAGFTELSCGAAFRARDKTDTAPFTDLYAKPIDCQLLLI